MKYFLILVCYFVLLTQMCSNFFSFCPQVSLFCPRITVHKKRDSANPSTIAPKISGHIEILGSRLHSKVVVQSYYTISTLLVQS